MDVVVWAIVSEYAVDGEELFFKGVCDFISEEDFVEKFGFFLVYDVVVEEVVCYCKIRSIVLLSEFKDVPNFQQSYFFVAKPCAIYSKPEL